MSSRRACTELEGKSGRLRTGNPTASKSRCRASRPSLFLFFEMTGLMPFMIANETSGCASRMKSCRSSVMKSSTSFIFGMSAVDCLLSPIFLSPEFSRFSTFAVAKSSAPSAARQGVEKTELPFLPRNRRASRSGSRPPGAATSANPMGISTANVATPLNGKLANASTTPIDAWSGLSLSQAT